MKIVTIIVAIILNRIYHKIFDVTYFSFGALITEWGVCLLIAAFICAPLGALFE